ncbi:MAG: hypothetical protein IPI53_07690 [Saprospiraceae bacterium]|nr:hypothetical protein [Saprospiraceae bacterium]
MCGVNALSTDLQTDRVVTLNGESVTVTINAMVFLLMMPGYCADLVADNGWFML